MPTLIDIISKDTPLRLISATHGGEYAGPCPFCGGRDRLRVWPTTGKWTCRQCKGFHPYNAKEYLEFKGGLSDTEINNLTSNLICSIDHNINRELWENGAFHLMQRAREWLWTSPDVESHINWFIKERGIKPETLLINNIGLIPNIKKFNTDIFGMKSCIATLLPGFVIPSFDDGHIVSIKIKTFNGKPKYSCLTGSSGNHPYVPVPLNSLTKTLIIVEGELDALLLSQDVTSVQFTSLGSAGCKWNQYYQNFVDKYEIRYIIPDNDEPGYEHAKYLQSQIKGLKIIKHSKYKDVTDMKVQGKINLTRFLSRYIQSDNETEE